MHSSSRPVHDHNVLLLCVESDIMHSILQLLLGTTTAKEKEIIRRGTSLLSQICQLSWSTMPYPSHRFRYCLVLYLLYKKYTLDRRKMTNNACDTCSNLKWAHGCPRVSNCSYILILYIWDITSSVDDEESMDIWNYEIVQSDYVVDE